jgi:mRNA-degrading endonuclease YafQ of YafQ-DinJ toxin-antitoxin module
MYALVTTRHFDHSIAKFNRAHPELRRQLAKILRDLESDPFQPHLRLHLLKGPLEGLHAVRLTHAYRVTRMFRTAKREVILLDIGSHEEVYR